MPIRSQNHMGTITKQLRLVIIVTRKATASLPPARRVQTAAVASVQGADAARIIPIASSGGNKRLASQPNGGATPLLINEPNQAGPGCRTAFHSALVSNGNAMINVTMATIALGFSKSAMGFVWV